MSLLRFCTIIGLLPLLGSCEKTVPVVPDTPTIPVESVAQAAEMNQVLAWKLFQKEQGSQPDSNILIAPYSIQLALTMAANGGTGTTRSQLLQVMGCDNCDLNDLNGVLNDLNVLLTAVAGQPRLTIANRFFYDSQRMNVHPPFLQTLSDYYQSGSDNLDFSNETAALAAINGWVNDHTNQKIEKILDRITAQDIAFLINALHFQGDWLNSFPPELTFPRPFKRADGSVVEVDFMSNDYDFTFAQTAAYNMVDLPFKDSTFSLTLIQPSTATAPANWPQQLTREAWLSLYTSVQHSRAIVNLPKLNLSYGNDLINSLQLLGVMAPFSERDANFSLLGSSSNNIFIHQIRHKAVLKVDEHGAEGAAVTSAGFGVTSVPPTFWFDRPFVIVLRHIPTHTLIFNGYIADPSNI